MTYVVTERCIRCKYTDCVAVCPVDAFREGETMLVIDPDSCIDCAVCEPACPAGAIELESNSNAQWLQLNRKLAVSWPSITARREPLPDAEKYKEESDKYVTYRSDLAEVDDGE